ncbi:MAG: hypothetical protein U1D30_13865 [Planctomycetota bacterium]
MTSLTRNDPNGSSDIIFGDVGRDIIQAGNGNNFVYALAGDDDILTGSGRTRSTADQARTTSLRAWGPAHDLRGGQFLGSSGANDVNTIYGDTEDAGNTSGSGDLIYGDIGNDVIYAGAGTMLVCALGN